MHKHIFFPEPFLKDTLTKLLLAVSSSDQQFRSFFYYQTEESGGNNDIRRGRNEKMVRVQHWDTNSKDLEKTSFC